MFSFFWVTIATSIGGTQPQAIELASLAQLATIISVLLALAMVILGIQLNREYEVSELSGSLKSLSQISEQTHFLTRIQDSWPARTRAAFGRALRISNLKSFQLRDPSDGFPYFTTRFYWDGVWFRLADTPLNESLSTDDQKEAAAGLHEVLICALEVLSCYVEMKERGLFISTEESGTNGCRWCHESIREFLEIDHAFKIPILIRTMTIKDARAVINLAVQVSFLIQHEVRDHKEEHFSDPLKSAEFSNFASRLMLWLGYFKVSYDNLRFAIVRQRLTSDEQVKKVWENLLSSEHLEKMNDTKTKLQELNDAGRSGSATRLRAPRLYVAGSIAVIFGTLFLLVYALSTPFSHVEGSTLLRYFVPLSFFFGITSILSSGIFVLELLMGREVK